ncbi:MAG: hypothetical protein RBU37_01975 [Myxococcota bacterium]|nr:hypothetical protein [Myxococcota bacterium]
MRFRFLFVLISLLSLGLLACDDGGDSNNPSSQGRVATVTGQLSAPQGKGDAATQVKVSMVVGANKTAIPAKVNPKAKEFAFTGLPAGDKTLLIDLGNGPLPVKFPKASGVDAWAAFLPDLPVLSSLLDSNGMYALELGLLTLSDDETAFIVAEQYSPFRFFDTDGNGTIDWSDDDIDGDGIPNLEDETPFGEEWMDWGWLDEVVDDFDADGDGTPDWEDEDFTGDWFDLSDVGGFGFCELDDDACWASLCDENDPACIPDTDWCASFPDDVFCNQCVSDAECGDGWTCDDGACVPVGSACDSDVDCEAGQICVAGGCVTEGVGCNSDIDCEANQSCVMNACVDDVQGCSSDADCETGEQCTAGACVPQSAGCSSDAECGAGQVCTDGICMVESGDCSSDDDCMVGEVCMSGYCVPDF